MPRALETLVVLLQQRLVLVTPGLCSRRPPRRLARWNLSKTIRSFASGPSARVTALR